MFFGTVFNMWVNFQFKIVETSGEEIKLIKLERKRDPLMM